MGFYDWWTFAETHHFDWALFTLVGIGLFFYIRRDLRQTFYNLNRAIKKVNALHKLCKQCRQESARVAEQMSTRCDLADCPGLAKLEHEIKENGVLMKAVTDEQRATFVDVLGILRAYAKRNGYHPGNQNGT